MRLFFKCIFPFEQIDDCGISCFFRVYRLVVIRAEAVLFSPLPDGFRILHGGAYPGIRLVPDNPAIVGAVTFHPNVEVVSHAAVERPFGLPAVLSRVNLVYLPPHFDQWQIGGIDIEVMVIQCRFDMDFQQAVFVAAPFQDVAGLTDESAVAPHERQFSVTISIIGNVNGKLGYLVPVLDMTAKSQVHFSGN